MVKLKRAELTVRLDEGGLQDTETAHGPSFSAAMDGSQVASVGTVASDGQLHDWQGHSRN